MMTILQQPEIRRPLSTKRIVDCALGLASRDGIAGVSMRKLASELGVEAMSLYHHVPSKAMLMALMAQRSISELPVQDPARPWDERLVELLMLTYRAGVENPAVLHILASDPEGQAVRGPADRASATASISLLEALLALLAEAQLPTMCRVRAYRGLIGLVVGFIAVAVGGFLQPTTGRPKRSVPVQTPTESTLLSAIKPALERDDPAAALGFTVRLFVQGLPQHGSGVRTVS
jgi:TetR/AcrR family tetracycline transcriptional repressor